MEFEYAIQVLEETLPYFDDEEDELFGEEEKKASIQQAIKLLKEQ